MGNSHGNTNLGIKILSRLLNTDLSSITNPIIYVGEQPMTPDYYLEQRIKDGSLILGSNFGRVFNDANAGQSERNFREIDNLLTKMAEEAGVRFLNGDDDKSYYGELSDKEKEKIMEEAWTRTSLRMLSKIYKTDPTERIIERIESNERDIDSYRELKKSSGRKYTITTGTMAIASSILLGGCEDVKYGLLALGMAALTAVKGYFTNRKLNHKLEDAEVDNDNLVSILNNL